MITGFGPFPGVTDNPSIRVAEALAAEPPAGVRVVARELPVTFEGAPQSVAEAARELEAEAPGELVALLGLGVQPEASFRLEQRARGQLDGGRADNAGITASAVGVDAGADLTCPLDLEQLAGALRGALADLRGAVAAGERPAVVLSDDAGGYVCERTYHALLTCARERGLTALFLHIPPAASMDPAVQAPIVRALVAELARQSSSSSSGRSSAD